MSERILPLLIFVNMLFVWSFFGFIMETAFSLAVNHRLENRKTTALLPLCPVYGFGAIAMQIVLVPFRSYPLAVMILGLAVGTAVEYLYGLTVLGAYHVLLWDYGDLKHSFRRLITPIFSFMWCGLSLVYVYLISPVITPLIAAFPTFVSIFIIIVMSADFAATLFMLNRIKHGESPEKWLCPVMKALSRR